MFKKLISTLLFFGILIFGTVASAEIKIYEGIGVHYMENSDETLDYAKDKAKLSAELAALEQAQFNIKDYSEANNYNLTRDEIITITAGILNVTGVKYKLSQEHDGIMVMEANVTAEIDTDKIPELVEREIQRKESK